MDLGLISAVMVVVQDFRKRQVSLIWALIFLYRILPRALSMNMLVILGVGLLLLAYCLKGIAWVDVIACMAFMFEDTWASWGTIACASLALCGYGYMKNGSLPLLGALAASWLLGQLIAYLS